MKSCFESFSCDVCQAVFVKECYFNVHKRLHMCRKNDNGSCEVPSTFDALPKLDRSSSHQDEFQCESCMKYFYQERYFNIHKHLSLCKKLNGSDTSERDTSHKGNFILCKLICKLCNNSFSSEYHLKLHLRDHGVKNSLVPESTVSRNFSEQNISELSLKHNLGDHIKDRIVPESIISCEPHSNNQDDDCIGEMEKSDLSECSSTGESDVRLNGEVSCNEDEYVCKMCKESFSNEFRLNLHMKLHTSLRPYVNEGCGVCVSETNSKMNDNSDIGMKTHECKICSKVFSSELELTIHKRNHADDENESSACKQCSQDSSLCVHRKGINDSETYECKDCNALFSTDLSLKIHAKSHMTEISYDCDVCKEVFSCKSSLSIHKKLHAREIFQCDICLESFSNEFILIAHKKSHVVTTSVDDEISSHKTEEKIFQLHSSKKSFKCKICEKRFAKENDLNVHIKIHAVKNLLKCRVVINVQENDKYDCEKGIAEDLNTCKADNDKKSFTQETKRRTKMHRKRKAFQCETCGSSYKSYYLLTRHRQIHGNINLHTCELCGKTFLWKSKLNRHIKCHSKKSCLTLPSDKNYSVPKMRECGVSNTSSIHQKKVHGASAASDNLPSKTCYPKDIFQSETCKNLFNSNDILTIHRLIRNLGEANKKSFVCEICGRNFSSNVNLHIHKVVHYKVKPHQIASENNVVTKLSECEESSSSYSLEKNDIVEDGRASSLSDVETLLPKKKSLQIVSESGQAVIKSLKSKMSNTSHVLQKNYCEKVAIQEPDTCSSDEEECHASETVQTSMSQFNADFVLGDKDTPSFQCKTCGKSYAVKEKLRAHKLIHTSDNGFTCVFCNQSFMQKSDVLLHEKTHAENKPFSCEICGARFSHMSSIFLHMKIHSSKKPFQCDICNVEFAQKSNFIRHKQKYH